MISDPLIFKHLNSGSDIRDTVENLISEANANGGKDNISVVLARIL
jgi:serine/threonine protein phosphatase PrpC